MLDQFWSSLKSGTDIRGVASEGGGYEINLTDDVVKRICKGFAIWLEQKFHMSSDCLVVAVGLPYFCWPHFKCCDDSVI